MNEQRIAEDLLVLLEAHHVKIRREPLGGGGGGLVVIKGENLFFVDLDATAAETAAVCAEAVVKVLDIETVYLRPEVRQYVENRTDLGF
jgi:hypothetical protein